MIYSEACKSHLYGIKDDRWTYIWEPCLGDFYNFHGMNPPTYHAEDYEYAPIPLAKYKANDIVDVTFDEFVLLDARIHSSYYDDTTWVYNLAGKLKDGSIGHFTRVPESKIRKEIANA